MLTGSPITDMKITLAAGRAHVKHTEGGDFRQATYRAVRQGLMQAESILLEPWYDFRLELPAPSGGPGHDGPPADGGAAVSAGDSGGGGGAHWRCAGVRSGGLRPGGGRLHPGPGAAALFPPGLCPLRGPGRCAGVRRLRPDGGIWTTPPDSVFCTHGAGVIVPWDEVPARAHVDSGLDLGRRRRSRRGGLPTRRGLVYAGTIEQDKELQAIFERTYGPVKRRAFIPPKDPGALLRQRRQSRKSGPSGSSSPDRSICWWTATTSFLPGMS